MMNLGVFNFLKMLDHFHTCTVRTNFLVPSAPMSGLFLPMTDSLSLFAGLSSTIC